jgi:hypothetical protein
MNRVSIPQILIVKIKKINQRLLGYTSPTFKKTIIDVYVTPNQWFFAKDILRHRNFEIGYPILASDELTIVAAFDDYDIEEVRRIVKEDNLDELRDVISDLPDMLGKKEEWNIGDSRVNQ